MNPSLAAEHAPVPSPRKKSRLLLWVVVAFLIQAAAWTAWFTIAANHRVAEVPLESAVSNKR